MNGSAPSPARPMEMILLLNPNYLHSATDDLSHSLVVGHSEKQFTASVAQGSCLQYA